MGDILSCTVWFLDFGLTSVVTVFGVSSMSLTHQPYREIETAPLSLFPPYLNTVCNNGSAENLTLIDQLVAGGPAAPNT